MREIINQSFAGQFILRSSWKKCKKVLYFHVFKPVGMAVWFPVWRLADWHWESSPFFPHEMRFSPFLPQKDDVANQVMMCHRVSCFRGNLRIRWCYRMGGWFYLPRLWIWILASKPHPSFCGAIFLCKFWSQRLKFTQIWFPSIMPDSIFLLHQNIYWLFFDVGAILWSCSIDCKAAAAISFILRLSPR